MYPTVSTLMGLWRFVIAQGVAWRETKVETGKFLQNVTLEDLQDPETWLKLTTLVQLQPGADILPVRASYDGKSSTIGLNRLSSDFPLWFTLADCIASQLLTGKPAKILRAITFEPELAQKGLTSISIAGNHAYRIDPAVDDFYKRLIDLRSNVKTQKARARGPDAVRLDAEQRALKILANSTSYGIFVELKQTELEVPNCFATAPAASRSK